MLGARADAEIAGEIDPTDGSGGIDEEFGGAGDIVAADTRALVKKVVGADCVGVGIREKRVRVARLAAEVL